MKTKNIIIILIILLSTLLAFFSMMDFIDPYYTIEKAKITNKRCQVAGVLNKMSIKSGKIFFYFIITDNKNKLQVKHPLPVPNNFSHSEKIVAIGKYNSLEKIFIANKLLLKCPSKYQSESLEK